MLVGLRNTSHVPSRNIHVFRRGCRIQFLYPTRTSPTLGTASATTSPLPAPRIFRIRRAARGRLQGHRLYPGDPGPLAGNIRLGRTAITETAPLPARPSTTLSPRTRHERTGTYEASFPRPTREHRPRTAWIILTKRLTEQSD